MSNFLVERCTKYLSKEESEIWEKYTKDQGDILSPIPALKLYELFLNGNTCQQIAKARPEFSLGAIVDARLRYKWDERKEEYINSLYKNTNDRAVQIQMEAVQFVADMLAVTHKVNGEKYKKFLMTGNPADLGDLEVGSIKQYKEVIELLFKLTGQENNKKVVQHVTVEHSDKAEPKKERELNPSDLLRKLEQGK